MNKQLASNLTSLALRLTYLPMFRIYQPIAESLYDGDSVQLIMLIDGTKTFTYPEQLTDKYANEWKFLKDATKNEELAEKDPVQHSFLCAMAYCIASFVLNLSGDKKRAVDLYRAAVDEYNFLLSKGQQPQFTEEDDMEDDGDY